MAGGAHAPGDRAKQRGAYLWVRRRTAPRCMDACVGRCRGRWQPALRPYPMCAACLPAFRRQARIGGGRAGGRGLIAMGQGMGERAALGRHAHRHACGMPQPIGTQPHAAALATPFFMQVCVRNVRAKCDGWVWHSCVVALRCVVVCLGHHFALRVGVGKCWAGQGGMGRGGRYCNLRLAVGQPWLLLPQLFVVDWHVRLCSCPARCPPPLVPRHCPRTVEPCGGTWA